MQLRNTISGMQKEIMRLAEDLGIRKLLKQFKKTF